MKYKIPGLIAALSAGLLAGCNDDIPYVAVTPPAGDQELELTIGASYPASSRASDAGFEDGDRMGVYVADYIGDEAPDIGAGGIRATNVRYVFDGSDNTWSGATPIYWKDGKTPVDIVAYYPFVSNVGNPHRLKHSVAVRQDEAGTELQAGGYEASDLLIAKAEKAMPTTERVDLTFRHAMAGLRITLQEGTGFAAGEWNKLRKSVMVDNVRPDAEVDLSTGNIESVSGDPVNIIAYEYNSDYRAVVVPQTIATGNDVVTVSVDGIAYKLVKDTDITYTAGKLHIFTIKVDRRADTGDYEFTIVNEAITAWIDDVEFRDGLMRQYITVEVAECGGLKESIKKLSVDPSLIVNLKIRGKINERDFEYMRNEMPILKSLHLKDAVSYYRNLPNIIPPDALLQRRTLAHMIFPDELTEIGSRAFEGTGIIGDLIIPEGVKRLSANSFAECSSLTGSISLPSTLEYIEGGSFFRTPLSGELRLPASLKRIEAGAFTWCKFTGELVLPENLEYIGENAFNDAGFSGTLEIPQGIKTIGRYTFINCGFSLLILHEGLERIDEEAFMGVGFRGELQLPSTVWYLGNKAFKNTQFSSIVFGEDLSYIGEECFAMCSRLSGELVIPKKVDRISSNAFAECPMLQSVVLHEDVTSVNYRAFFNCYNLEKVVCHNPEPPSVSYEGSDWAFTGVPMNNFTLEVPEGSEDAYARAKGWREFRRISAYSNFVCRPQTACALNTTHTKELVLNSDGPWTLEHKPDWCTLSATSGNNKTALNLTIDELPKGSGNRTDSLVFRLDGTEFITKCMVSQYDYQYGEDEAVKLQSASRGNGVDIVFVGDGFDARSIASGDYMRQVNEQMEYFFGLEPYATYRDYFNVYALMSLSQETGVNTVNNYRDTRFLTYYGGSGKENSVPQLNINDSEEVFNYVMTNARLTADRLRKGLVIMTMNSDEYGGATYLFENGRAISICSPSSEGYPNDTRGIVQHEAGGHGFGKLGDELIKYNKFVPENLKREIANYSNWYGWYRNLSVSGRMADVPWSHFIYDPRYSNAVDIFEGGFGYTRGVYRSEINSCMNYGIPYYNAISRQEIVRRILDNSGERFTMEKFYANDSDKWGSTNSSRAALTGTSYGNGLHHPVTVVKTNVKRKIK